jgi:DNA repair protein RecO (recombination protein O)
MIVNTKAIVLFSLKYSDTDLIVTCFTEISGLKTYLLPRILNSKKAKVKASLFQPLTQLDLVAIHKDRGTLEYIKEAKLSKLYITLHTNILKTTLVLFLSEILKNSITEEQQDLDLFNYLSQSFIWLDENETIANFHILFLLKLSAFLGFYPDISLQSQSYFNLIEGVFQESATNNYCEKGEAVENLKLFFGINFDDLHKIKMNKKMRLLTLNLLITYFQLHLHAFKQPKSLQVLNQLFL